MGKIKEALISDFLKKPIKIGDSVYVRGLGRQDKNSMGNSAEVIDIITNTDGSISVSIMEHGSVIKINPDDYERVTNTIGVNVFTTKDMRIRNFYFDLRGIMSFLSIGTEKTDTYNIKGVDVDPVNWNPYVVSKNGTNEYYQREFVWSLKDKQNLIDSIYNYINCGSILVRKRSWQEIEKLIENGQSDVAFIDIVDGKQRMNAISEFTTDQFPDSYGNFFSDLSKRSHGIFYTSQLFSFGVMDEDIDDQMIIKQFLKLNFTGVPQSSEHLEFVKSINNRM